MTYSTLASIVKYPRPSYHAGEGEKFGFFTTEHDNYVRIADELGIPMLDDGSGQERWARHPLVYLVEAADDICYEIMDIEDAHKLKILTYEETERLLLGFFDEKRQEQIRNRIVEEGVTDENERVVYLRACAIGLLVNECVEAFVAHEEEILDGTFQGTLVKRISPRVAKAYEECNRVSVDKIYNSKLVLTVELSGYKIMETLMQTMVEAALYPTRFHSQQLINLVSNQYDIHSDNLETRIMAVLDYISGMTDVFALDLYRKINGMSLPNV